MHMQAGLSLSMRSVFSISILLYATTLVTGMGAAALAAHEILRQTWIFAIQCVTASTLCQVCLSAYRHLSAEFELLPCVRRGFTAFDIATQSLVASYMGRGEPGRAREVLLRVLQLGLAVGGVLALAMVLGSGAAPAVFTGDPAVVAIARRVFPLLGIILVIPSHSRGTSKPLFGFL